MKQLFIMFASALSVLGAQAVGIAQISGAFKQGDASSILTAMDKVVEVTVLHSFKKCDGKDAVAKLNEFFKANKPADFTVLHHADKKDNGFFVGKLSAKSGEFRVNITYRVEGDKAIIQSIRIE
jgi:hypothetical protein